MQALHTDYDRSNIKRLLAAFRHQEPDRLPHLELWVTSQAVYEYVLERKLSYKIGDAAEGGQSITPEDDVEFAQRLGQTPCSSTSTRSCGQFAMPTAARSPW